MNKPFSCKVEHYQELSGHVMQVLLAQPRKPLLYHAGQYVEFLLPGEEPRPFSIANAPDNKMIEFHIRHAAENSYTRKLLRQIRETRTLTLGKPCGNMGYQTRPPYPLIFLAAGTGFAPCKAIIEQALKDEKHSTIYLYWGARHKADLYWNDALIQLRSHIENFYYTPVLSAEGRVYEKALRNHPDFSHFHVYASGPAEMVFAAQEALSVHNLNLNYFYSDWLALLKK